jgi:hypothetical protein
LLLAAGIAMACTAAPAHAIVCDLFQDNAYKVLTGITDAIRDVGEIVASGGVEVDPARDRKACDRARSAMAEANRGKAALATERSKCPKEWAKLNAEILDVEKSLQALQAQTCK